MKQTIRRVLFVGAGLCALATVLSLLYDWRVYQTHPEWSASFSAYVMVRLVEFVAPGIVMLIAALLLKTRNEDRLLLL